MDLMWAFCVCVFKKNHQKQLFSLKMITNREFPKNKIAQHAGVA